MDKKLLKALLNYFDTLFQTGYLPQEVINKVLVLKFLNDLTSDCDYAIIANSCEKGVVNKLYNCVTKNNCLL